VVIEHGYDACDRPSMPIILATDGEAGSKPGEPTVVGDRAAVASLVPG